MHTKTFHNAVILVACVIDFIIDVASQFGFLAAIKLPIHQTAIKLHRFCKRLQDPLIPASSSRPLAASATVGCCLGRDAGMHPLPAASAATTYSRELLWQF